MPNLERGRILMIILLVLMFDGGFVSTMQVAKPGERARAIKFDPQVPIADRLLPQDDVVTVEKSSFPPLIGSNSDQTLKDALDHAMLYDAIVVARGLKSRGTLIDRGTWIRGSVNGSVIEVIKPGPGLGLGANTVTFWHDNGEMFVKHALVRAGVYPVYSPNEDYLLFLNLDEVRGLYPGRTFRITGEGVLAPILQSNGETKLRTTPIHGQSVRQILDELRRRVAKK